MAGRLSGRRRIQGIGGIEAAEIQKHVVRAIHLHHVAKLFAQPQISRPVAAAKVHRSQQDLVEALEGHQDPGLAPLQFLTVETEQGAVLVNPVHHGPHQLEADRLVTHQRQGHEAPHPTPPHSSFRASEARIRPSTRLFWRTLATRKVRVGCPCQGRCVASTRLTRIWPAS
jgi:hypothetical protein